MTITIIAQADGSIVTVSFLHAQTDAQVESYAALWFPQSTVLGEIDPAKLPPYRFRDCWRQSGQAIQVDMALARAQRLVEIRAARNVRFAALDAEWMRALGQKRTAEADAIEAKRQVLRDIPQTCAPLLDACGSVDELIAFEPNWPEV